MDQLAKAIRFSSLLHAFQRTDRSVRVPGTDRLENDAEHSYLLATFAWYLIDTLKLGLDKQKAFEYALAHDMVEVYAGDTPAFGRGGKTTEDTRSSKKDREAEALKRLKSEFPEFPSFTRTMEAYDTQQDEEARFIYALDKLVPIFGGHAQDGRDWKQNDISFKEILEYKVDKIKADPAVHKLFQDLMALIGKDQQRYFKV